MSSLRIEQEQRDNLELQAPCCVRGRLDEAKETAETKGEPLSREDVHDILQGMQDPHEDGPQL